jgi:tetratricopeptide (TPR) repeat protein
VLEGSVQRVDNTIRINAQLIDGQNDNHVWSEYYDRNISDLLSIQSEVAQQIADKLAVKIKPATKASIVALPTKNTEAYDLYRQAIHAGAGDDSFVPLLEKAIGLDSQFASPYASLGLYWVLRFDLPSHEIVQKAEPLLNKALSLDRDEVNAHIYLCYLNLWHKWDFYTAEREANYAAQLEPSNPGGFYTDIKTSMGKFDESVEFARLRVRTEPRNIYSKIDLGFALYFAGRHEESKLYLDSAAGTAIPNLPSFSDLGRAYLYLEKYESVVDVIDERALNEPALHTTRNKAILAIACLHLGKNERSIELLHDIRQQSDDGFGDLSPSFYAAMVYAQMGENDLAFQYLEKSFRDHEVEMYWLKVEPPFKPLHKDPRWQQMLDKVGFPE